MNLYLVSMRSVWFGEIFGLMNKVTYPLKCLSVCVSELTEEGMRDLCAMGPTIESLELEYIERLESFKENIYSFIIFKLIVFILNKNRCY